MLRLLPGLFKSAPRAPLKTSCLARYAFELRVFPNRRERRVALDRAQRRESLRCGANHPLAGGFPNVNSRYCSSSSSIEPENLLGFVWSGPAFGPLGSLLRASR